MFYFQNNRLEKPEVSLTCFVEVFVKSVVLFALAIVLGRIVSRVFPDYDETKARWELALEISFQIGVDSSLMYVSRQLMDWTTTALIGANEKIASNYASMVFAIGIFSVQSEMKKKMVHLITGDKQTKDSLVPVPQENDEDIEEPLPQNNIQVINQRTQNLPPTISTQVLREESNPVQHSQPPAPQPQYTAPPVQESGCQSGGCNVEREDNSLSLNDGRASGYCASGDQSCNNGWSDTMISRGSSGEVFGMLGGNYGAPIM